jgi:SAM-dependent methyltransferase
MYLTKNMAITWLANYLDQPDTLAREMLERSTAAEVAIAWQARFSDRWPTPEEERAFYAAKGTGKLYILELLHWNMSVAFRFLQDLVRDVENKHVLEIGSGIGTLSYQLFDQVNTVAAIEPNQELWRFARRHPSHGGLVNFYLPEQLEIIPSEYFDVAVAFDVLEHLSETDLIHTVYHVARTLKPGGVFYYHNNWDKMGDAYPMHHDHSSIWTQLLEANGLLIEGTYQAVRS